MTEGAHAPQNLLPGAVTCCCVIGNVIYAFSDIGHIYRVTPNPFSVTPLLTPPGAGGGGAPNVGEWQLFLPDAGWTNVTLRYRRVPGGLQIEGAASGGLPANSTGRVGVLSEGFRPTRQQFVPIVCGELMISSGWGMARFDPDGALWTRWSIGQASMAISAIIPLD